MITIENVHVLNKYTKGLGWSASNKKKIPVVPMDRSLLIIKKVLRFSF